MSQQFDNIILSTVKTQEQGRALMEKLIAVARPESVYGQPVTAGDYTIITASEVAVGMGFGQGIGGGTEAGEDEVASADEPQSQTGGTGFGGGGGGGGGAKGRPVAVITVGPEGVQVEPVVDPTKIALAFFTMLGSMFIMLGKMRKAAGRG